MPSCPCQASNLDFTRAMQASKQKWYECLVPSSCVLVTWKPKELCTCPKSNSPCDNRSPIFFLKFNSSQGSEPISETGTIVSLNPMSPSGPYSSFFPSLAKNSLITYANHLLNELISRQMELFLLDPNRDTHCSKYQSFMIVDIIKGRSL